MPLDTLSGSRVFPDESHARRVYPYVCWSHPMLYPGVMVPSWAVAFRDAFRRAGCNSLGRELLKHVKSLFPPPDESMERANGVTEDHEPIDWDSPEERAHFQKEQKGLEVIKATIALLDLFLERRSFRSSYAVEQRELATNIIVFLETAGVCWSRRPAERERVREELIYCARDTRGGER